MGSVQPPIRIAAALVLALLVMAVALLALVSAQLGREPRSAWVCDDTRFTQIVPRGRAVVGTSVSPAPGCLP